MPLSDNVDPARRQRSDNGKAEKTDTTAGMGSARTGRRGIPQDLDESSNSILTPILSHLPSLAGIPSLRGFLPTSPSKQVNGHASAPYIIRATWQEADLGDGRGKTPLLLITPKHHALQIFRLPANVIPDDPHVQETFPAPEEVFNLPVIRYTSDTVRTALPGASVSDTSCGGHEHVLEAKLLEIGRLTEESGALVILITVTLPARRSSALGALALIVASLRTGFALRRVDLGPGRAASVASSTRVIAVSVSYPQPEIHLLDASSLIPSCAPICDLPVHSNTGLPTFSLSGRLLAFVTSEPPRTAGPDGLGSLVTARSTSRVRSSGSLPSPNRLTDRQSPSAETTTQGALLNSAAEISGGVARGVWAGIKLGARAAGRARNGRLARSAPVEGSVSLDDDDDRRGGGDSESRSLDESSVIDEPMSTGSSLGGGEWIKVVDLKPRSARKAPPKKDSPSLATTSGAPSISASQYPPEASSSEGPEVIAHFRLPLNQFLAPSFPAEPSQIKRHSSALRPQPISNLSFSPSGTQLFAAAADGRIFHVFDIHPAGALSHEIKGECKGEVWHLYELRRGSTAASVCEVTWDKDGRWLGVGTGLGTIHVFPISPSGGRPSAASHVSQRIANPEQLHPLSTIVHAIVRLRPRRAFADVEEEDLPHASAIQTPGVFTFLKYRQHPLEKGMFCDDMVIFRSSVAEVELARLSVRQINRSKISSTDGVSTQRRASALTEMIRSRAGLTEPNDLSVTGAIRARWCLPLGSNTESPILLISRSKQWKALAVDPQRSRSLAHAEIQSHCNKCRILPPSPYLSRQIDFFAAKPIDENSPLSILDLEARAHRLVFRREVEAQASSPELKSFDEPLLSALHTVIESPTAGQIPGLPNGYPARNRWRSSVPIRHVAAGLGDGVHRVRREYVRAQHSRSFRRASGAAANKLSFEEDAVFASGDEGSSPSSGVLPGSSVAEDDREEPDGWGEGWDEEYRRAVEDDGGPDDLVLGLLEEEEEERRKWEIKQKVIGVHNVK